MDSVLQFGGGIVWFIFISGMAALIFHAFFVSGGDE
jgi:hypothetical protein